MVKEVLMKAYLYNIFSALILKLVPEKYLRSAHQKNHTTQHYYEKLYKQP